MSAKLQRHFVYVCTEWGEYAVQINSKTTASNLLDELKTQISEIRPLKLTLFFAGEVVHYGTNILGLSGVKEQSFYLKTKPTSSDVTGSVDGVPLEIFKALTQMQYTKERIKKAYDAGNQNIVDCVKYLQSLERATEGFFTDHA